MREWVTQGPAEVIDLDLRQQGLLGRAGYRADLRHQCVEDRVAPFLGIHHDQTLRSDADSAFPPSPMTM